MNLSGSDDKRPPPPRSPRRPAGGDVGKALRSVYDNALKEDIPLEMLDLLGKLG
ncbi:MAG: Anti-sigma factor NepR [Sphingomonadales bacterium]|jgi:hypothetical protein|nr:Anti-sigma factor NepR [Sphingomonadales bacterium]